MAKPDKPDDAPKKEEGEIVTYRPGEGDPSSCKWRGIEFKANVPVRIKNVDHVDAARGNKFFHVGSDKPEDAGPRGAPKTAMEYRGHVVDWMERVRSIDDLAACWSADRGLREKCEVGQDDVSFLGTLVEPKLRQLRLEAGLTEMDVAGIWVKHGVLDLPWRS
jgi:hypothetical protein